MSSLLKFYKEREHAELAQRLLAERSIKTFTRERAGIDPQGDPIFGYDLFVLREEDFSEAEQLLRYELGSSYGV